MVGSWLARRGAGAGEAPSVWLLREVGPHSLDTDTDTNILIAREQPSPRNNLLIISTVYFALVSTACVPGELSRPPGRAVDCCSV